MDSGGDRWLMNGAPYGGGGASRMSSMSTAGPRTSMPWAISVVRSAFTKNCVGLSTETSRETGGAPSGTAPLRTQARASRQPMRRDRRRPVGRGCRQRALHHQPAARRRNRDARPIAGGHARSHGDAHGILVVLQRADAGCIVVGEVVPRPPESQAVIVERVVVADDAAGDHAQSARLQLLGPRAEDVGRLADARIARSDDDQVSLQDARVDASGRKHARLVRVIPAQALRGGGQRHDFHVRRGHHQPSGVERNTASRRFSAT